VILALMDTPISVMDSADQVVIKILDFVPLNVQQLIVDYTKTPGLVEWGKIVFDNPTKYPTTNLVGSAVTIGRNKKCTIHVPHPVASGLHCTLTIDQDNIVFLEDSSTNGTWVNKKFVGKGRKTYLNHVDEIEVVRPSIIDPEEVRFTLYLFDLPKSQVQQIGKYEIGKQIGTGSFAKVHLSVDTVSGEKYAMKIIDKKRFQMNSKGQPREGKCSLEEVNILKRLNHPNIIKVVEAIDTEDALYIILDLVTGGDLLDKMVELGHEFPEDRSKAIFLQMVAALLYLHSVGIVHRDLKPENILLVNKMDDRVKLTDFGLSRIVGEGDFMQTVCGTPSYVAPEVISKMKQSSPKGYGKEVDVWSLGVILFMLLCGEPPFDKRKPTPILEQVAKGEYKIPARVVLSADARELISQLLQVDPKKRITLENIAIHPWIVGRGQRLISPQESQTISPVMGTKTLLSNNFSQTPTKTATTRSSATSPPLTTSKSTKRDTHGKKGFIPPPIVIPLRPVAKKFQSITTNNNVMSGSKIA